LDQIGALILAIVEKIARTHYYIATILCLYLFPPLLLQYESGIEMFGAFYGLIYQKSTSKKLINQN
jgi:hypothetical protein